MNEDACTYEIVREAMPPVIVGARAVGDDGRAIVALMNAGFRTADIAIHLDWVMNQARRMREALAC
ncbi:MAG: hypothetical protein LCH38_14655 [Proteobacteria bacterium]|nr:hypothetical protein [Pseudomonadota bacterium]